MMALNFALLLVFDFSLVNLGVRNQNDPLCEPLEPLEGRFSLRWFARFHNGNLLRGTEKRKTLRDANKEALEQVEKATDLESDD